MSFVTVQEKVELLLSLIYKEKKKIRRQSSRKCMHPTCGWRGPPASSQDSRRSEAKAPPQAFGLGLLQACHLPSPFLCRVTASIIKCIQDNEE